MSHEEKKKLLMLFIEYNNMFEGFEERTVEKAVDLFIDLTKDDLCQPTDK